MITRRPPDTGAPTKQTKDLVDGDTVLLQTDKGAKAGVVCCVIPTREAFVSIVHVTNLGGPFQATVRCQDADEWEIDQ